MKKSVTFKSKGLNCSANLYIPDDRKDGKKLPVMIMAGGISGVKERHFPEVAERFAAAGIAAFVFDYRFFGDSEGEPRQQLFPLEQVEDYRNAISYLETLPEIDPNRIGIFGTSLSGGLVVYVASFDKRVKCVISQVPALFSPEWRASGNPERWEKEYGLAYKDRLERYQTGKINHIQVVGKEGENAMSPSKFAYESFMGGREKAPNWKNELTMESVEKILEFNPTSAVGLITAPIMFVAAMEDAITPDEVITTAYMKVKGPKSIVSLPCNHFEVYKPNWMPIVVALEIEWCKKYL